MMSFDTEARTQAVLTLYTETLADVQFPDVDCAVLTAAAAEVAAAREALASAEAALDGARGELRAKQIALQQLASRGLAYARIYAEANEPLRERMAVLLGEERAAEATPSEAPKRRGRPRRVSSAPLLDVTDGSEREGERDVA